MEQGYRWIPTLCQRAADIQCLGWQECDGGVKKWDPATLMPSQSSQSTRVITKIRRTKRNVQSTYGARTCTNVLQQGGIRIPTSFFLIEHPMQQQKKHQNNTSHHPTSTQFTHNTHYSHPPIAQTKTSKPVTNYTSCINQQWLLWLKGEISSVKCCRRCERASLGSLNVEVAAWATVDFLGSQAMSLVIPKFEVPKKNQQNKKICKMQNIKYHTTHKPRWKNWNQRNYSLRVLYRGDTIQSWLQRLWNDYMRKDATDQINKRKTTISQ